MKPKPWQTRKKPTENISEIIQSNPTVKQEVPKLPPSQLGPNEKMANPTTSPSTNSSIGNSIIPPTTNAYGGYGAGSYGSSYGGYGGYGGGYGSYGSYGMGMGMGGMYGMGRYGLMGGQDQKGFLVNTMMTLDSFSYLINCLCEIAGSLDRNYEGLSLFYKSFKNLITRFENSFISGCKWVMEKIKNFFLSIFRFVVENIFFMGEKKTKSKYQALKVTLTLAVAIFAISFYPLVRKAIKSV